MEDKKNMGHVEKPEGISWNRDQIEYQQSDFMQGVTDYAKDQYYGTEFGVERDIDNVYPDRTDSTSKEYYGKERDKC